MINWIVASSILIVVVIVLRCLLKGKISLRLQYALWGMVLLRLLIPFNVGSSILSVMNIMEKTQVVQDIESVKDVSRIEQRVNGTVVGYRQQRENTGNSQNVRNIESTRNLQNVQNIENAGNTENAEKTGNASVAVEKGKMSAAEFARLDRVLTFRQAAVPIWLCGMILLAVVFILSNIRFSIRLRRTRQRVPMENCRLPVYLAENLDTPCLFGIFRPAIYITKEAAEKEAALRHTVEHEMTHFRHGDHIWAILRGVCLVLHWYNPLVWCAAVLSRNDAELACDEATIKRLGEAERARYGCTLIGMTCRRRGDVLVMATTMVGSGRNIKERIALIVRKPKTALYTLLAVILIAAMSVGVTFTGCGSKDGSGVSGGNADGSEAADGDVDKTGVSDGNIDKISDVDATANGNIPGSYLPEGFWNLSQDYESENRFMDSMPNCCLRSLYATPGGVNLEQMFYDGVGLETTEADRNFVISQGGWGELDIIKVPRKTMDEVLKKYFDLTLEETGQVGMEGFIYNPENDTYYTEHGDTNAIDIEVEEEYMDKDGHINVVYRRKGYLYKDTYIVTLEERDGRYIFLSNVRCVGRWRVTYSYAEEFLAMEDNEGIEAWLDQELGKSLPGLYADYDGTELQRSIIPGREYESLATCSDVIFYRAEQKEGVTNILNKMIEAMITPRMEPSKNRPYTITEYEIEPQEALPYYMSGIGETRVWIVPILDVYYSYDGVDLVSMEAYVNAESFLLKDGLMPLQRQGSGSMFVFILIEKDGVYRLQRAEDMMEG